MPKTIKYLGAHYREVDAGILDFFKKKPAKDKDPQLKSDTKVMDSAPGADKTVVEQDDGRLAKIAHAAMFAYTDLVNFFKPLLGEKAEGLKKFTDLFTDKTNKQQKLELGDLLLRTFGGYIKHVNEVYKNDTRPEKKKTYEAYEKQFGSKDPLAPIVRYVDALKNA